jgi:hypothetical protein
VFAKIAALIIGIGVIACALLGIRQMRIQAAAETALIQRKVASRDRDLWHLRIEIASRITPDQIEKKAVAYGMLKPINPERYQELVSAEARAAGQSPETEVTANTTER